MIHMGPKLTPFEFHYRTKPRTVLTNLSLDGESHLSDLFELFVSAWKKPKVQMFVTRDGKAEITNYLVVAITRAEKNGGETTDRKFGW